MGRIPDGTLKNWQDNEKVLAADYKRELEILRVANNDNHDNIIELQTAVLGEITGIRSGTSFPTVAKTGDLFYKSDTGFVYFFNSVSWQSLVNFNQFTGSEGSIGWSKTPDGWIDQWGWINVSQAPVGAWSGTSITFPIAFPSYVATIQVSAYFTEIYTQVGYASQTKNGFQAYFKPESLGSFSYIWRARGK